MVLISTYTFLGCGYKGHNERETPLFIYIRVAHSDALGTPINWGPDKN